MFVAHWLWIGALAVGVSSNPDLGLDAVLQKDAAAAWNARHVAEGAPQTPPAALNGPLHFELASLQIPKVTAFGPILEAYLQREMVRGWQVLGSMGPVGGMGDAKGLRSAVFTRRHARWGANWGIPGRATPIACAQEHAEALACYLVTATGPEGAAQIKLGGSLGHLRVFPRILVTLHGDAKTGWRAESRILVFLRREDAEKLKVPPGELGHPMRATLSAILQGLMVKPTVDGDADGQPDAWRFEAAAGWKVTPRAAPAVEKPKQAPKLNAPPKPELKPEMPLKR